MAMVESDFEQALRTIARIAGELSGARPPVPSGGDSADGADVTAGCCIMALPARLQQRAAELAVRLNPVNAPPHSLSLADDGAAGRQVLPFRNTTRYWGPRPRTLSVSFVEAAPADVRARIVGHLNAWSQWCGISFAETAGTGEVRISRAPEGSWSYLGTDIMLVPPSRQTMTLSGFTMNTSESEYRRVVRHEAGHVLGFPHEHLRAVLVKRIDPQKAYAYFWRTQGWSKETVDELVLTSSDSRSLFGTEPDQDSVMSFHLPGAVTRDGTPIWGGADINQTDARFAGLVYPKDRSATASTEASASAAGDVLVAVAPAVLDWAPEEDVHGDDSR
jgi:hypothetical protein